MINAERITRTLLELLAIPSPSGFTDEIVHYVGKSLDDMGVSYDLTRRGTIRARLPGGSDRLARAVVTHVDTIGAMVRYIRDDGRLLLAPIGHWSSRFGEGARVTLFSDEKAYRGCLLPTLDWGVSRDDGVDEVPHDWDHLELRLEEAVFSADDVRRLGVEVGNFIALDSHPEVLENGYIIGRNLDNKAGTAAVLETLHHLVESGTTVTHDTYVLFTVTETTGGGMGTAILPEVSELLTVDFESVEPTEKSPFKRVTLASGDASGPYDYHLTEHLHKLAEQDNIPLQQKYLRAYHSDAAAALIAGHDVRTAVIAYAGDASHSVERTHIESLTNVVRLLTAYATSEPTFAEDAELTTVDDFSHQIDSSSLPRSVGLAPDAITVLEHGPDHGDDA
ncbi:MAG: osmoprotectant NAGGN system M42 family peptidase [Gammaproteobacteria bacterium]